VYVACSSLCFSRFPLSQALHAISEMRFQKVELAIHESGNHLKPSDVKADVAKMATLLKKANLSFAAFHVETPLFGEPLHETLKAICRLARLVACPLVNIKASPIGSDMTDEVKRLTLITRIAKADGVILTVDTDCRTLTADPKMAAELCQRTPDLGLTLDPSHYLVGQATELNYEDLYPFVRHVRLRDSAPSAMQVKIGQGQLEYAKIITGLERESYNRALCVDMRDGPEIDYPVDAEVRKLKYLLESMV
jgi:sugar phosphate isomerase/epimerase